MPLRFFRLVCLVAFIVAVLAAPHAHAKGTGHSGRATPLFTHHTTSQVASKSIFGYLFTTHRHAPAIPRAMKPASGKTYLASLPSWARDAITKKP